MINRFSSCQSSAILTAWPPACVAAIMLVLLSSLLAPGLSSASASNVSASQRLRHVPAMTPLAGVTRSPAPDTGGGKLRWHYQIGSGVDSSPTMVNDVVYVGSTAGYEYALTT